MTIQEQLKEVTAKLSKLDERHQALAQTLELAVTLHFDLEKETRERSAELDRRFAETDRRFAETDRRFAATLDMINRLGHIAEAHEDRLDQLEGN